MRRTVIKTPALYQVQTIVHICVTVLIAAMLATGAFASSAGDALGALVMLATGSNAANGVAQVKRNGNKQEH